MLARFTQIDYDREIALVAIDEEAQTDNILGVARIIGDADGKTGEFAVLVGDVWQGRGIGGKLLEKCLLIAERQGFKTVHGIVLKENKNMLTLGKKLGFEAKETWMQGTIGWSFISEGGPIRKHYRITPSLEAEPAQCAMKGA